MQMEKMQRKRGLIALVSFVLFGRCVCVAVQTAHRISWKQYLTKRCGDFRPRESSQIKKSLSWDLYNQL